MSKTSTTEVSLGRLVANVLVLIIVMAAILFLLAGRQDWLQAWAFILVYGGFLLAYAVRGARHDPAQIAERSRTGQNAKVWDRVILAVYTLLLVALLVVVALDAGRFRWAPASLAWQMAGWLGLVLAGWMVWWAVTSNTFLSRVVRIQEERGQVAITTGAYRYVRHPMYAGIIVMMLSLPLALGSLWGLAPGGLIAVLFVVRTMLEDKTLQAELPGYAEYAQRTHFLLIPFVW